MLKSLSISLLFLLCGPVWAACSGSSPTWTAANATRAEVAACVTAASSGDTINVPSGTSTWASDIELPNNKDLAIIGATSVSCTGTPGTTGYSCSATDNTVLTCAGTCFVFDNTRTQRVSGFTMTVVSGSRLVDNTGPATGKYFRLDHNHLIGAESFTQLWIGAGNSGGHAQGVADNNLVEDCAFRPIGTFYQWDEGTGAEQHVLWAQQPAFGGGDARVFIESNHFKHDAGGIQSSDSNYGGRYVYRFNLVDSGFHNSEVHGMQGENRGSQHTEIYENVITTTTGCSGGTTNFRGGTGVIWGNYQAVACSYGIDFTIDRSEYDEGAGNFGTVKECGVGGADGDSPTGVDQKVGGQNSWRCRDQIGTWYDATEWQHTPSFGSWDQVQHPVYVWSNLTGASAMDVNVNTQGDIENKIIVDREFYCDAGFAGGCNNGVRVGTLANIPGTCTTGQAYWVTDRGKWRKDTSAGAADGVLYRCSPDNTWSAYYIPYQYPHEWVDGDDQPSDMTFGDSSGTAGRLAIFLANWAWFALAGLLGGIMYAATSDRPRAAFASAAARIRARVRQRRNPGDVQRPA